MSTQQAKAPKVGVVMGSRSDWETLRHAADVLDALGIAHEAKVVSAHRTPDRLYQYAKTAEGRGLDVIIAGAGGAAHLPGMVAALTILPVLGVPVESKALRGVDLVALDRPDAQRRAGGDFGDWRGGGGERGTPGGGDPRQVRPERPRSIGFVSSTADRRRG